MITLWDDLVGFVLSYNMVSELNVKPIKHHSSLLDESQSIFNYKSNITIAKYFTYIF